MKSLLVKRPLNQNSDAQVAGIFIISMGLIMIALYVLILCPLMAECTDVSNNAVADGQIMSTQRAGALSILQLAFNFVPVFAILMLVAWGILNALMERTTVTY